MMLGGRALAAALAVGLLAGCATAAAQTGQRTYLPSVALGFPPTATSAAVPTATPVPGRACAADRLAVRTMSDADASTVSAMAVPRTVGELADTAAPSGVTADTPRLARIERSTFQIQIALVRVTQLASGSLALLVADPDDQSKTAIVELPDPDCSAVASSSRRAEIAAARAALLACGVVPGASPQRIWGGATILGVGFFDPSSLDGSPANGLGLAPTVGFESADCSTAGPVSPTATPRRIGTPAATWTSSPVPPPGSTPTASGTPTPAASTATPVGTATPTRAATLTQPPTTYVFSGRDSQQSSPYTLTAGRWNFSYTFTGTALNAYLLDSAGTNRGTIAVCNTSCQGTQALTIPADGPYRVQVNAAGTWSFTFRAG